jgi:methylated-DNA-[protein]-cysteine S-methyltransferase
MSAVMMEPMSEAAGSATRHYVSKAMASPVGMLTLVASDEGLSAVLWEDERPGRVPLRPLPQRLGDGRIAGQDRAHSILVAAERQLREYFAGQRTQFTLALDVTGTPFQRQVWAALRSIPYGETRSYAQIAEQIGHPRAVRAVGAANGRNPLSIVAPCHRVIGSGGQLTGFAGGLEVKARLLAFESGAGLPLPDGFGGP